MFLFCVNGVQTVIDVDVFSNFLEILCLQQFPWDFDTLRLSFVEKYGNYIGSFRFDVQGSRAYVENRSYQQSECNIGCFKVDIQIAVLHCEVCWHWGQSVILCKEFDVKGLLECVIFLVINYVNHFDSLAT